MWLFDILEKRKYHVSHLSSAVYSSQYLWHRNHEKKLTALMGISLSISAPESMYVSSDKLIILLISVTQEECAHYVKVYLITNVFPYDLF